MLTKHFKNTLPYFVIAGIALFMFRGIFAPGFMSGYDNSFHYYDAHYLVNTLIPEYHSISGWSMQHLAGFPVFVDYYQTGFWIMAFLNKLLFLPLNFSYKLMVLASFVTLGAGFYKLASYRFGKFPALIISICLMLQKDIYYSRILGGMWSNYLAIGMFFVFFHILDKNSENITLKKASMLAILLAVIILTHLYAAIAACAVLAIYAARNLTKTLKTRSPLKRILPYAYVMILGLAISSCYLYGFVIGSGYFRKLAAEPLTEGVMWGFKSFFGPLESVNSVSSFLMNIPVITRIIFSFFALCIFFANRRKNYENKSLLICTSIFTVIFLVFFMDVAHFTKIPLITTLQISRFLIYVQLGLYVFATYGLAKFFEFFKAKKLIRALCMVPIAASLFFHYTHLARDASRTLSQSPQMQNVHKTWNWVDANINPKKERIVYQSTRGNVNDPILARSDVFALSGVFTGVQQIGVSRSASPFPQEAHMRNDHGAIFGRPINETDSFYIKTMMDAFNAGHIISVEPNLENMLGKSELFSKEARRGIFSIFRLKNFKSKWITFEKDAAYENFELENQRISFDIVNKDAGNEVFVKVAYHPFWQARLDGIPVKVEQDGKRYGLMKVSLPEKGSYELELSFNSFSYPWVIISFVSFMICAGITVAKKE